jgi:hypothetical protein
LAPKKILKGPEVVADIAVVDPADDDVEEVHGAGEVQAMLGALHDVPQCSGAEKISYLSRGTTVFGLTEKTGFESRQGIKF